MRMIIVTSVLLLTVLLGASSVAAQDGMIKLQSPHDVATTLDKLTSVLESKGMSVFGRVNHASNAENAGMSLRPTEVLIFGNPKIGTPLMLCSQSVAIDLPQKMLAWEDEMGATWLGWNDPTHLKSRHAIEGCDEVLEKVTAALNNFAKAATSE